MSRSFRESFKVWLRYGSVRYGDKFGETAAYILSIFDNYLSFVTLRLVIIWYCHQISYFQIFVSYGRNIWFCHYSMLSFNFRSPLAWQNRGFTVSVLLKWMASQRKLIVTPWKTVSNIKTIIAFYEPSDIFNAYETWLFFKCLLNKTFNLTCEKCFNGEKFKERLSILFTVSMTVVKSKPLVISNLVFPRCFKEYNIYKLAINYHNNKKAWMTWMIWKEWLIKIVNNFQQQSPKFFIL